MISSKKFMWLGALVIICILISIVRYILISNASTILNFPEIGAYEFIDTNFRDSLNNTVSWEGDGGAYLNSGSGDILVAAGSGSDGPDIDINTSGDLIIVWTDTTAEDGDGKGIFAQRYDEDRNTVGEQFQINTYTVGDQLYPQVSMNDNGDFIVVWESLDQDGSEKGIFGKIYNSSGIAQCPSGHINCGGNDLDSNSYNGSNEVAGLGYEFRINTTTISNQSSPVVSVNNDKFVVVWNSPDLDGSGVFGQMYNMDGSSFGSEFQVNTYTSGDQEVYYNSLSLNDSGQFVAVWTSWNDQDGDDSGIFGQRYNSDGSTIGSEFQVNTTTTDQQSGASVSMNNDNEFIVAWHSRSDGNEITIFSQRYNSDGSILGYEFQINTTAIVSQWINIATVSMNDNGQFVIVWDTGGIDITDFTMNGYRVHARIYDAMGNPIDAQFQLNTIDNYDQQAVFAVINNEGNFLAAWEDSSSEVGFEIRYNIFNAFGELIRDVTNNTLQTITLDETSSNIIGATLSVIQDLNTYGSIDYELSNNGGTTFEAVTVDEEHIFGTIGSDLRLRATLSTTNDLYGPEIDSFSLQYTISSSSSRRLDPIIDNDLHSDEPVEGEEDKEEVVLPEEVEDVVVEADGYVYRFGQETMNGDDVVYEGSDGNASSCKSQLPSDLLLSCEGEYSWTRRITPLEDTVLYLSDIQLLGADVDTTIDVDIEGVTYERTENVSPGIYRIIFVLDSLDKYSSGIAVTYTINNASLGASLKQIEWRGWSGTNDDDSNDSVFTKFASTNRIWKTLLYSSDEDDRLVYPIAFLGVNLSSVSPSDVFVEYDGYIDSSLTVNTSNPSLVRIFIGGNRDIVSDYSFSSSTNSPFSHYLSKLLKPIRIYSSMGFRWKKAPDNQTGEIGKTNDNLSILRSLLDKEERFIYERTERISSYEKEEEYIINELVLTYKQGDILKADVIVKSGDNVYTFRFEEIVPDTITKTIQRDTLQSTKLSDNFFYIPISKTLSSLSKSNTATKIMHINLNSIFMRFDLPTSTSIQLLKLITKTKNIEAKVERR